VTLELVHVDPEPEVGGQAVGAVPQDNHRQVGGRTQGAAQAVHGDVEAVAGRRRR
jgi:hypothetical protein